MSPCMRSKYMSKMQALRCMTQMMEHVLALPTTSWKSFMPIELVTRGSHICKWKNNAPLGNMSPCIGSKYMSKMQALRCMLQMMEHVLALTTTSWECNMCHSISIKLTLIPKTQGNWPPEVATIVDKKVMLLQIICHSILDLSTWVRCKRCGAWCRWWSMS